MPAVKEELREILTRAEEHHKRFGWTVHDQVTEASFARAQQIAARSVKQTKLSARSWQYRLDRILTSRITGLPIMIALLALIFWITIVGANIPSAFLSGFLRQNGGLSGWFTTYLGVNAPALLSVSLYELLHRLAVFLSAPWWLTGFLIDGVYLGLAWVVSVMLPPMAIFFPLFTLLEDFGYLPRVAFNLDKLLRRAGAHGKQSLTMSMGFGCNAAGVIACRIIDSPRERLIAILTNTFVPCNGRWPTLILIASLFVAASVPAHLATAVAAATITAVTLIGIAVTLLVSLALSRTVLRGEPSAFTLELPPYRRPQLRRILYTSLIDRTIFVLWRAIICAAPAGGIIWLLGAIQLGDATLYQVVAGALQPIGDALGMDGVILLAFIFAIPANEIVLPTIIMGYQNLSRMTELSDPGQLFVDNGWTLITAACVMLFSLLHYPCTTTTLTIWSETRSARWTLLSNLIPLGIAMAACFTLAQLARALG
jgi:ferrous iron transport protein B